MSRAKEQQRVRQRDRFICQLPTCNNKGEQYAHIVPDVDDGPYVLDNLIFFCADHHKELEPARTPREMKERLINIGYQLRDQPKQDGLLKSIFAFASGTTPIINLANAARFVNERNILGYKKDHSRPYLSIGVDEYGLMIINGHFEDQDGFDFMTIRDNTLQIHTSDIWDIYFRKGALSLIHKDKNISLSIRQKKNLEFEVTGDLYLNGAFFTIKKREIMNQDTGVIVEDWQFSNNVGHHGIFLLPEGLAM